MRDTVLEILYDIKEGVDFENSAKLIDDGELESLDVVALVGELNDEFDIQIGARDLIPANFNSVDAIVELIKRLQD